MKVKSLIKKLEKLNPNLEVVLASDAEGNSFGGLFELVESKVNRDSFEPVEDGDKGVAGVILFPN